MSLSVVDKKRLVLRCAVAAAESAVKFPLSYSRSHGELLGIRSAVFMIYGEKSPIYKQVNKLLSELKRPEGVYVV